MSDTAGSFDPVIRQIRSAFPDASVQFIDPGVPAVVVSADTLVPISHFLKATPGLEFDYLASLTAIDYLDRIDLVYQLRSQHLGHDFTLRIEVERDDAVAPSVTEVWRGANFQEREIYDLMGVRFAGHPNLKRILLYDEFDGHPLRKDWRLPAEPRDYPPSDPHLVNTDVN